jgi:hypothetical protein
MRFLVIGEEVAEIEARVFASSVHFQQSRGNGAEVDRHAE